jgi:hypothetical protein
MNAPAAGPRAPPKFGDVPVPFTASWTGESVFFIDRCPHAAARAICQAVAPGTGKPQFGKRTPSASGRPSKACATSAADLFGTGQRSPSPTRG